MNNSLVQISEILQHSLIHKNTTKLSCTIQKSDSCFQKRDVNSISDIMHRFAFHAENEEDVLDCLGELITYERSNDKTPTKIIRHISFESSDSETEESEVSRKNPVRLYKNRDTKIEPGCYPD